MRNRWMEGGRGGEYSSQWTIQVCAALKSLAFRALWSEKGIRFD